MKYRTILAALTIIVLLSCGTRSSERPGNSGTLPDPLKGDVEYKIYKRGADDIVESLYAGMVKDSIELQNLENHMDAMSSAVPDSTRTFLQYNEVNQQYYASLDDHFNRIKDTAISRQIQLIADQSKDRYSRKIASHKRLLGAIEIRQQEIADMKEAFKIILTLPEIHKYQDKNLPSSKPMLEILKELEQIKKELEAVKQRNST